MNRCCMERFSATKIEVGSDRRRRLNKDEPKVLITHLTILDHMGTLGRGISSSEILVLTSEYFEV